MAKNDDNLIDFGLDPAVEAVIHGHERNQEMRSMPLAERRKLKREQAKADKRKPRRFAVDMDEDLIEWAKETGEKYSCPASQIIQLAVQLMKDDVSSGTVNLHDYRVPANGPRYENRIFRKPVGENSS
jgi:hypothetical protein